MKKELSQHIITEVKGGGIRGIWPRLMGKNGKNDYRAYGLYNPVVIIKTDTGFTGWGYGVADPTLKLSLEGYKLSEVFDPSVGILNKGLRAADIALHDLAGKILGIPVSKMINPNSQMEAPCYDGAIYMNDLSEKGDLGVDEILKDCRYDYNIGYVDFKVKIGRETWMGKEVGLKRDIEVIRQIRKEFPKSKILVDGNDSMDLKAIIKFMDAVKDCSIYWIEEPFRENYNDYMELKEYLAKNSPDTLIADGEFDYNREFIIELAKKGAVDCLLMDPESFGFTEWRRFMKECEETNIKCSPHCWGTKLKTNIVAHLAAAFPAICPTIEGVPEIIEGVDETGYVVEDGILSIPEKGGFGMEFEFINRMSMHKPY